MKSDMLFKDLRQYDNIKVIEKIDIDIKEKFEVDIIIGKDVIGGIFAIKENIVYYFAPDLLNWECLNVYYANFMNWLINYPEKVNLFYKLYRWNNWEEECKKISLSQGFSFYPFLFTKYPIENRSRKTIEMDELINLNFK